MPVRGFLTVTSGVPVRGFLTVTLFSVFFAVIQIFFEVNYYWNYVFVNSFTDRNKNMAKFYDFLDLCCLKTSVMRAQCIYNFKQLNRSRLVCCYNAKTVLRRIFTPLHVPSAGWQCYVTWHCCSTILEPPCHTMLPSLELSRQRSRETLSSESVALRDR